MATSLTSNTLTFDNQTLTSDVDKLTVAGSFSADKVYNAVWNDIVDALEVPEGLDLKPGYVYSYNEVEGYHKANKLGELGALGIHSDTYGYCLGFNKKKHQLYIAIGGFVLAYVDKIYPSGTLLTSNKEGILTRALEGQNIIAKFFREENKEFVYGGRIRVNGRHWVKVC